MADALATNNTTSYTMNLYGLVSVTVKDTELDTVIKVFNK